MKRSWMGLMLLPALVISSCEYKSYEEHELPPYDGILTFTEVNKKADWKNRYGHAAVSYKDKMWIIGGYNPGELWNDTYYEDVWSSEDGIIWELVTDDAPWKGRKGHTVNVFDDGTGEAIYLIGGFSVDDSTGYRQYNNDVWKSTDGLNWTQLRESIHPVIDSIHNLPLIDSADIFYPRMDHTTVVANHGGQNYLFIIGGRTQLENVYNPNNQKYFNDVWRSSDGINWERLPNNDFGIRAHHASAVDPETGIIYIQGGMHGILYEYAEDAYHPIEGWNYLWSSPDGITWTSEAKEGFDKANFSRVDHEMVYFDNALWIFPGRSDSKMHYTFTSPSHYRVWNVDLGSENIWTQDSNGTDIGGRHSYGAVVFKNKIWFLGGFTNDQGQDNDVWTAEK